MIRNILVPVDGSKESESILQEVQRIATLRDQMHLLHVVPPVHAPVGLQPTHVLALLDQGLNYLGSIRERALPGQPGLDLVRAGDPVEEILGAVLEKNISLIAMSTHGRSAVDRLLMGSVALEVVKRAQLPVLLTRPDTLRSSRPVQRILLAVEGFEPPRELLETVKYLAGGSKAEIILFHAVPPVIDPAPQWAVSTRLKILSTPEHRLQELADLLEKEGYVAWPVVSEGKPEEEILAQIQQLGTDLVVLPTHARSGFEGLLAGSVAEGVLRRSPVAVVLQKSLTARKSVLQEQGHA